MVRGVEEEVWTDVRSCVGMESRRDWGKGSEWFVVGVVGGNGV